MSKYFKRKGIKKAGLPPGSLIYVGEQREEYIKASRITFKENFFEEKYFDSDFIGSLEGLDTEKKVWLNLDGLHEVSKIELLGQKFDLHSLLLEDVLNTDQRPKVDEYEDSNTLAIVVKMFYINQQRELESEQVSLILGKNFLISLQEKEGDVFHAVRERLRQGRTRIRTKGTDYLAYALIDSIVDNYFTVLETLGDQLEKIEESLIGQEKDHVLDKLHALRRQLIILRKAVWPLREVISRMEKGDFQLIHKETRLYIRDLYDHTVQVMDSIETYRDILSGLHDMHMTNMSNRMNEIMKVLTIIATIFIPITFIAGVYGMNFDYMPELGYRYGYFFTWAVMIGVAFIMLIYFRKKKWL